MDDARDQRVQDEVGEKVSMLSTGTTGAEARDRVDDAEAPAEDSAAPTPYGSREEVLERVMVEQREIGAAHGSTPAADPRQRSGFNRILSLWTLAGALLGAGVGAFAGWLAVHYRGSATPLIGALAAVGLIAGAVIVGAYRVEAEDGRVQSVVEAEAQRPGAGSPGDEDAEEQGEGEQASRAPVGTRSGG
jgi:hypothetical protein